jgi:serine/threonine protein kinase
MEGLHHGFEDHHPQVPTQAETRITDAESETTLVQSFNSVSVDAPTVAVEVQVLREKRNEMTQAEWVDRVVRAADSRAEIPDGYQFPVDLHEELAQIPDAWRQVCRQEDRPPPPVFSLRSGMKDVNVPDHVYAAGVKWSVGDRIGGGGFGSVYQVSYGEGKDQKNRLVKIIGMKGGERPGMTETGEVKVFGLEMLWNEVGAAMAAGDFLCSEMIQDDNGDTMLALVMDQYKDQNMVESTNERLRSGEEILASPEWGYQIAVAVRSVVATLRKMHSRGWTHRDVKPANIMLPDDISEAMLAHLIDFGAAQGKGVVRKGTSERIIGSPSYMLPETYSCEDDDLRLRDYWAAMVSAAVMVNLVEFKDVKFPQVARELTNGTFFEGPQLNDSDIRNSFFEEQQIEGAQRDFLTWVYDFLQPHMHKDTRQRKWRADGVTRSQLLTFEVHDGDEVLTKQKYGDYFNDEKFVSELEDHIRGLAAQAGVEMPEDMIERFQEF